ncbi:ATP-grasp domain-containing protein [Paenibacillus taiwanensis]|uniref:ATP-grasp domain-containing protein n=1 Tax=Paenibacillus taiwanensis TaxID=401638 RepID=UPI0004254086|nr:ATP-grasp domain-containing protein [Paenibacillus taiwanensis]
MTKIWFNRWFSVAYHYIHMIRSNPDQQPFVFYGTHPDPNHMHLQACDYAFVEPTVKGAEYVQFCLDFCKQHSIDIFIPRLHMYDIAEQIERFEAIGTKVMVCKDLTLLHQLMNKHLFYEALQHTDIVTLPAYRVVNTAAQFKQAYEELTSEGNKVCFKPTSSEGGMGFRIIAERSNRLEEMYGWVTLKTSFEDAYQAFASKDWFDDIMVMELLEGDEYSIDCLSSAEGELLTAIPRRKSTGRVYELEKVPALLDIAERVAARYRIPYVFNIQVKYNKGIPKLLEINPRMSGGLYISCLSGINIPYLAVKEIQGQPFDVPKPKFDLQISYIEQPIVLKSRSGY